jgi:DNA-binding GntR family transcriptional regulator
VTPEIEQSLPKYLQVANYIRDQILRGELGPGDAVPSERQIVETWKISRPTATRALAALRSEGLVEGVPGVGTLVRADPVLYRRPQDRYVQMRRTGRIYPPGEYAEIRSAEVVIGPPEVVEALGLEPDAEVICRSRVTHDASGTPVAVTSSWFDASIRDVAPKLLEPSRIVEGTPAYVEQTTGRRIHTAQDRISPRLAIEVELQELQLEAPAAVMVTHHTGWDAEGKPLEFAILVQPTGRWVTYEYNVD